MIKCANPSHPRQSDFAFGIILALAVAVTFSAGSAYAQALSEGPLSPGSVVNDASFGTSLWANPGNAASSDDVRAVVAPGGTGTQYLKATGFGFSLPSPAQILGIEANVERLSIAGTVFDERVRIVKGGVIGSTDRSAAGTWPIAEATNTYGSPTDLWGETWTPANINGAGFGVALSANDSFDTAGVDHITMTVYYTLCADTPAVGCRSAEKSLLIIKDNTTDAKDRLVWKWIKGESTSTADFSDPLNSAVYSLCLYADVTNDLIGEVVVPSSMTKWKPLSTKGFKYLDKATMEDGIKKIVVKASVIDKAKAIVIGKGDGLPDVTLPLDLPVTAQLINSDTGVCWEGSYDTLDIKKNEVGKFKAKAQN